MRMASTTSNPKPLPPLTTRQNVADSNPDAATSVRNLVIPGFRGWFALGAQAWGSSKKMWGSSLGASALICWGLLG